MKKSSFLWRAIALGLVIAWIAHATRGNAAEETNAAAGNASDQMMMAPPTAPATAETPETPAKAPDPQPTITPPVAEQAVVSTVEPPPAIAPAAAATPPAVTQPPPTQPEPTQPAPNATNASPESKEAFVGIVSRPTPDSAASYRAGKTVDLINVTVQDESLENVVNMFTRISGANIIATSTNLVGTVTVNLTDVEWKPALISILDMHGLTLIEKEVGSNVYSIVPKQKDLGDPLLSKSFVLHFSSVGDVAPVVRLMLPEGASISEFPSRNIIVIRTTAKNLRDIEELVHNIDIATKQICVEAKFMELNDSAVKQLGIKWNSLEEFGVNLGAGPFSTSKVIEHKTGLDQKTSQADQRQVSDNVSQLYDVYGDRYQVQSVEIVERPDQSFKEISKTEPSRDIKDDITQAHDISADSVDSFTKTIVEKQAAILEMNTLKLVLSALKTTDGVSIISNPKMIVVSGATNAFFSVGTREPIIKTQTTRGTVDSPGDKETAALDTSINTDYIRQGYLETGIMLKVIPVVKTENLIEAQIMPSIRRKVGTKEVAGNSWPVISVKEIRTKFTLLSGQTVAIGGLTDTTDEKIVSKIPILGDIPLIGTYLFSHTKDSKSQVETILFVTLALAEPEQLKSQMGIPEMAELVQQQMLKSEVRKRNLEKKLEEQERKQDAEAKGKSWFNFLKRK